MKEIRIEDDKLPIPEEKLPRVVVELKDLRDLGSNELDLDYLKDVSFNI
jgi:hypothetical protein